MNSGAAFSQIRRVIDLERRCFFSARWRGDNKDYPVSAEMIEWLKSNSKVRRDVWRKWQRQFFDAMAPGEFGEKALEYAREHPFKGKAKRI